MRLVSASTADFANEVDSVRSLTTPWEYDLQLFTVIETPLFEKLWPAYWTQDELGALAHIMPVELALKETDYSHFTGWTLRKCLFEMHKTLSNPL